MPADDVLSSGGIWLDLTRTLTRVGRAAPTGIDRVEHAWAEHLLAVNGEMRGICRTTRGFLLLPPDGVRALLDAMAQGGANLGHADGWSRLTGRAERPRHRAEALLRRHAIDRCTLWGLQAMAGRHRPATYVNVGHTNHMTRVLRPLRESGADLVVLIHDLIPITHPHLVPPEQPARFAERIACVRAHASLVVAVSRETESALMAHWTGQRPPILQGDIGVSRTGVEAMPRKRGEGSFLMVGTLEPRKNVETILKAWEILADELGEGPMPRLEILGQPGWSGADIVRQIEAHPGFGASLFLNTDAGDTDLNAAFRQADTLLYPTLAEGFGLPPYEALAHGLLPICSDLPVLRAGLGTDAVYADPNDVYSWVETIKKRISGKLDGPRQGSTRIPGWQDHFEQVSAALAALRDRAERP